MVDLNKKYMYYVILVDWFYNESKVFKWKIK